MKRPPTFLRIVAAGVVLFVLLYWLSSRRSPAPVDVVNQVRGAAEDVGAKPAPPPTIDPEAARRAALAQAKAEQKGLRDQAAAARLILTKDFPAELAKWTSDVEPLLTSDAGRAIAASEPHTLAFFREYEAARPSPEDVESLASQLSFLVPPLQEAFNDPNSTFLPDTKFRATLESIARQGREAVSSYRLRREAIERILRLAQDEHPDAAGPTLAAATRARRDREEAERIAREHAHLERQRRDALVAEDRMATEERRQKEEALVAQAAEERARAERRQEILKKANDPSFQRTFSVFLTRAVSRIGGKIYTTGKAHPAAFADIQASGALTSAYSLGSLVRVPDGSRRKRGRGDQQAAGLLFEDFEEVARVWVAQCKLLETAEDAGKPCTPTIP